MPCYFVSSGVEIPTTNQTLKKLLENWRQIPLCMRLVKAKKLAPHSMQGARKLYATERGSSGQPRMNEERAKSQKLTPRMWKTRRGGAVSDDSKRWSWMAPAPP